MGKIISLKSRNQIEGQHYNENEALINKVGRYIGVLPMQDAEELRNQQNRLICEQVQINKLVEDFDEHYEQYLTKLSSVFSHLGFPIDAYNLGTERLFIGEEGQMWVVKNHELDE